MNKLTIIHKFAKYYHNVHQLMYDIYLTDKKIKHLRVKFYETEFTVYSSAKSGQVLVLIDNY